jgi:hypothetical protein
MIPLTVAEKYFMHPQKSYTTVFCEQIVVRLSISKGRLLFYHLKNTKSVSIHQQKFVILPNLNFLVFPVIV